MEWNVGIVLLLISVVTLVVISISQSSRISRLESVLSFVMLAVHALIEDSLSNEEDDDDNDGGDEEYVSQTVKEDHTSGDLGYSFDLLMRRSDER